jgi:hypothetical protein
MIEDAITMENKEDQGREEVGSYKRPRPEDHSNDDEGNEYIPHRIRRIPRARRARLVER